MSVDPWGPIYEHICKTCGIFKIHLYKPRRKHRLAVVAVVVTAAAQTMHIRDIVYEFAEEADGCLNDRMVESADAVLLPRF